jgi:nucleoside-diphosphate-sugar epimerase
MATAGVKTFVLTGATGFLGGHLMAALVKGGERLIVLGRASPERSFAERVRRQLQWFGLDDRSDQVETLEVDVLEPGFGLERARYEALCARGASIIHCAADTRFSERNRREITAVNVDGLKAILDFAADGRAPFFHHVSTAYVAGCRSGACSEELASPGGFNNVYEETKARAEHLVAGRCEREGIAYTILRPSIVYGDSRNGRSTRFDAMYHPVRSLAVLRDIYLDDIRLSGGQKARACGIVLQDGGVLRMPVRLFRSQCGHVDLIPVDYFVSAALSIFERPESGVICHITSDTPKRLADLVGYCQEFLKIDGIEVVDGSPDGVRLTPPEALLHRFLEPYGPYLSDTRRFERTRALLGFPGAHLRRLPALRGLCDERRLGERMRRPKRIGWLSRHRSITVFPPSRFACPAGAASPWRMRRTAWWRCSPGRHPGRR